MGGSRISRLICSGIFLSLSKVILTMCKIFYEIFYKIFSSFASDFWWSIVPAVLQSQAIPLYLERLIFNGNLWLCITITGRWRDLPSLRSGWTWVKISLIKLHPHPMSILRGMRTFIKSTRMCQRYKLFRCKAQVSGVLQGRFLYYFEQTMKN